MMIQIHNLHKSYDEQWVLEDIHLNISKGSITGLLGPNGAGKTTLVSILTGIIKKDKGDIHINGLNLDKNLNAIRSISSIVPQTLAFYPMLTAYENLEYFAALYGLKGSVLKSRICFCAAAAKIESFLNKRAEKLSGGMKRRLNLAIGLLNAPEILYLDEPTVGVDAQSRSDILKMIQDINQEHQTTIVYTSHYMDEIEQISNDIAIIHQGRMILSGQKKDVLAHHEAAQIQVENLNAEVISQLKKIKGIRIHPDSVLIPYNSLLNQTMVDVFSLFQIHQIAIKKIESHSTRLEDLFLRLTRSRSPQA